MKARFYSLVGLMISGISGSEDPHNSLVSPDKLDIAVFLRFPSKWVLF